MHEKNYKLIIGRNIKIERINKSITQEYLAELIDMSFSYLNKVEQGLIFPTGIALYKISKILNIKMEMFFSGVDWK